MEDISSRLTKLVREYPMGISVGCILFGFVCGFILRGAFFGVECDPISVPELDNVEVIDRRTEISEIEVIESERDREINHVEEIKEAGNVCVDVSGAVKKPGVYCLPLGSRVIDALDEADGFKYETYAHKYVAQRINFAALVSDQQKVYIPATEELVCEKYQANYVSEPDSEEMVDLETIPDILDEIIGEDGDDTGNEEDSSECIDINSANIDFLVAIPGVGDSTAQSIIDNRPYSTADDLLEISGIGESKLAEMRSYICEI